MYPLSDKANLFEPDIFAGEQKILEDALLYAYSHEGNDCCAAEYEKLTRAYAKMLKQLRRSTTFSDRVMADLNTKHDELRHIKNGIIFTMADLVENRDKNTGGHIERTAAYIHALIERLTVKNLFAQEMATWNPESVISAARLHDIGKIAIPDLILNKNGPLTPEEFEIMKTHTEEGVYIIEKTIKRTGTTDFLENARIVAAYHHERWDGQGYPYGLAGTDIPLLGRIMSIVDVYDALVTERPYKKAETHEDALAIIMNESGKQFDPLIAQTFYEINEQILALKTITGNHRLVQDYLEKDLRALSRAKGEVCVIVAEIDRFGQYSADYGADAADDCTQKVADVLKRSGARESDFFTGYGEGKFILILPHTDEIGFHAVKQKIADGVHALDLPHPPDRVTVSIGGTAGRVSFSNTGEEFLKTAEEALTLAKQTGTVAFTPLKI